MTSMTVWNDEPTKQAPPESSTPPADTPLPRFLQESIEQALTDTRIAIIEGARQVGKSTLAAMIAAPRHGLIANLDRDLTRRAALTDPTTFVQQNPNGLLVIDEVQRTPDLIFALKAAVDEDPRPGRFLITGSADLLSLKGLDSLAGRAETFALEGFSQGELRHHKEQFIDRLLAGDLHLTHSSTLRRSDYLDLACAGGFPQARTRTQQRRNDWNHAYLRQLTRRDAPDLAGLTRLADLPRLIARVAATAGTQFVATGVAKDLQWPRTTLAPYLELLKTLFVIRELPGWSSSLVSRTTTHPKLYVGDSGLAASLLGVTPSSLAPDHTHANRAGPILETFALAEIAKQRSWSEAKPALFHFRDQAQREVDIVLEQQDGTIAAIEVKAAATITPHDMRGLARLRDQAKDRFAAGILLYTGPTSEPLGPRLAAVPLDALWSPPRRGTIGR